MAKHVLGDGKLLPGESISEQNTIIETDLRIKKPTVASGVEIDKILDIGADSLSNLGAAIQSQQCGGEAVSPVGSVAQPRQRHHVGGVPHNQEFLRPFQVVEQASAQMRDGVGMAIEEELEGPIPAASVLGPGGT